jgi:hypothetical protein
MSLIWLGNMEVDFRSHGDGGLKKPTRGGASFTLTGDKVVAVISSTTVPDKCSIKDPVSMTVARWVNQFCGTRLK